MGKVSFAFDLLIYFFSTFSSVHQFKFNPVHVHSSLFRPNSELLGLIQICIVTFRLIFQNLPMCNNNLGDLSEQPPVYSKPKDSQAQAAATSYPAQGAAYYPQGQV